MLALQALLRHRPNIEAQRKSGETSLILASQNGHLSVVQVSSWSFLIYPMGSNSEVFALVETDILLQYYSETF